MNGTSSKPSKRTAVSKLAVELLSRQFKGTSSRVSSRVNVAPRSHRNLLSLVHCSALSSSEAPNGIDIWLRDDDEYEDDIFHWECSIVGPPATYYEGGIFIAQLDFPPDFPNSPPKMRFTTKIWHPNVYKDGRVCISILHAPGAEDFNDQEKESEKWRPILSVEAVLLSVVSMLSDPNCDSPANVDAAVMLRKNPDAYKKMCLRCVKESLE